MTALRSTVARAISDAARQHPAVEAERIADAAGAIIHQVLDAAAERLETMHFLFTIQRPGTGPFTRQDITTREVVEQGAAAIRALEPALP